MTLEDWQRKAVILFTEIVDNGGVRIGRMEQIEELLKKAPSNLIPVWMQEKLQASHIEDE